MSEGVVLEWAGGGQLERMGCHSKKMLFHGVRWKEGKFWKYGWHGKSTWSDLLHLFCYSHCKDFWVAVYGSNKGK